jgi:hypothetical protein
MERDASFPQSNETGTGFLISRRDTRMLVPKSSKISPSSNSWLQICAYPNVYKRSNPTSQGVDIFLQHRASLSDASRCVETNSQQGSIAIRILVLWRTPALSQRVTKSQLARVCLFLPPCS